MLRFLLPVFALLTFCGFSAEPGKLVLTVLEIPDVKRGAGLAIVLQTPSGRTWLYDTGTGYPKIEDRTQWDGDFNAGRDLIIPFLERNGIKKLDGVMISHAHYDHFGGLMWLDGHFPIGKLIDSGFKFEGPASIHYSVELGDYEKVRQKFKADASRYQAAHTGDRLEIDPALEVEVLAPPKTFFGDPKAETRSKNDPPAHYLVNANSLGVRIQYGEIVFYLPGDIQAEDIDHSLIPSIDKAKMKCHVLIAPGHGIHCTQGFAEATRPEVSIASVFPRYAKGLKSTPMLKAVGAKTYITGLNGTVRVTSDGKSYRVEAEREDGASPGPSGPK